MTLRRACQLGNKFGADPVDALTLLGTAKDLGLSVVGVSFHVGSGATNPHAFTAAILLARKVFDMGNALGFNMTLLDIGGGFCGGNFDENGNVDLGGVPAAVNSALEEYFSGEANEDVRVIAEPGRYCYCPSFPLYWMHSVGLAGCVYALHTVLVFFSSSVQTFVSLVHVW